MAENVTKLFDENSTVHSSITGPGTKETVSWDDATWILTSSFIIFTMQSGFGLLEAGCVSSKNEVNIMVKNAVDVICGGITYWLFGYGFSFGNWPEYSNGFIGIGDFMVDSRDISNMGLIYSNYIFQLSFATTATTIVSGAMAERTKLSAYIVFSMLNTVIYCVPAHWLWADNGWLSVMGIVDVAGSSGVHLVGGVASLVAAILLKPRTGRFDTKSNNQPGNGTNCMVGTFMLWWGWLGFNTGSSFGISGGKWKIAAKSSVTTINASVGGGLFGLVFSFCVHKRKFHITDLITGILGGLVSITACCAVVQAWEAIIIGIIGAAVAIGGTFLLEKIKVDDPVGAFPVHGMGGLWGMIATGLFAHLDPIEDLTKGRNGLFWGGGFTLLGIQLLGSLCIILWSGILSLVLLYAIHKTMGLRMSLEEELLGADFVEHGIVQKSYLESTESHMNNDPKTGLHQRISNIKHASKINPRCTSVVSDCQEGVHNPGFQDIHNSLGNLSTIHKSTVDLKDINNSQIAHKKNGVNGDILTESERL